MIKYYLFLTLSLVLFLASNLVEKIAYSSDETYTTRIIGSPYQENMWSEKMFIYVHSDGNYHATITIEDAEDKVHVFTVLGKMESLSNNEYGVVSQTMLETESKPPKIDTLYGEPFYSLYEIEGYTLVGSFKVLYRDNQISIVERPGNAQETVLFSKRIMKH